jgi:xylan 1,4-beta-xylosidase
MYNTVNKQQEVQDMKYNNPIIPGFYPDPSICRVGEDYYLVTSSFQFYPGVPIFHSRDLIHWEQIGHCLTRESQLKLDQARNSGGIYAPTIRYHQGVFYMVTTNVSHQGNFYVTASDPGGDWSEPVWVEQGGIDPSLFFDDDGKVYFTSNCKVDGKPGISQSEIDIKTGQLLTPTRSIWNGTGGRYPEAPHLYKIHGYYYLMIAEGGTEYGHMITLARSSSPWGPFDPCPYNPILTHRDRGDSEIQGTGHGDLIQDHQGNWWLVFLAFRNTTQFFHHLGRETFLAPVTWREDQWPVVNQTGTVDLEMDAPCLPECLLPVAPARDDFDDEKLQSCWSFIRNPDPLSWSLTSLKGSLSLTGNEYTLNDIANPAFIGRRQQHFNCKVSTQLVFRPLDEGDEAGLTVYYDNEHHNEIGVVKSGEVTEIIVRKRIGDLSAIVAREKAPQTPLVLVLTADKHQYHLGYSFAGNPVKYLASCKTAYVSTEATLCSFTGVFIGLYATGNGKPSTTEACFDWFDYQ